jgi:hypothetical protein
MSLEFLVLWDEIGDHGHLLFIYGHHFGEASTDIEMGDDDMTTFGEYFFVGIFARLSF